MRKNASLQSSSLPSGVATKTPSCTCSKRRRYFSSAIDRKSTRLNFQSLTNLVLYALSLHDALPIYFAAKYLALFTGSVKLSINVQSHQFFPAGVPEHAQECVITIQ